MQVRNTIMSLALILGLGASAQAVVVLNHTGTNDPDTEGWSGFNTGLAGNVVAGDTDEEAHWGVFRAASNGATGYSGNVAAASFTDPSGWTATWRVKAIETADLLGVALAVADGQDNWMFVLADGDEGLANGIHQFQDGSGTAQISSIDPTDGYHWYQMLYNPGTDDVSAYIDGSFVTTLTRASAPNLALERIQFGGLQSGIGEADAHYAFAQLETGHRIVPEPASFALIGIGGLMLLKRRRK